MRRPAVEGEANAVQNCESEYHQSHSQRVPQPGRQAVANHAAHHRIAEVVGEASLDAAQTKFDIEEASQHGRGHQEQSKVRDDVRPQRQNQDAGRSEQSGSQRAFLKLIRIVRGHQPVCQAKGNNRQQQHGLQQFDPWTPKKPQRILECHIDGKICR